ncbi:flavin reductase family protein [Pseudoalteromonas sp. KS88]|uniref:flavin reductase family protein n=1 Tax=Pseudoalteromonas sp. KS88 TaxID=2109918 RepID=UPI001081106D|nr:flavin reductase family protein [Pseudoalteromonas sp. KS88]TGE78231.1 flavin reductase family protein [Pseudoalteromonas sp. KS88]
MFIDLTHPLEKPTIYSQLVGGITPRPIAWVSTLSADGVANIAPYSFFTVASVNPPVLSVTQVNPGEKRNKDTLNNLLASKECVVNIVSEQQVEQMNQSCANYSPEVSEFIAANIESTASQTVKPLSVASSKVRYECTLREVITISEQSAGGQMMLLDVAGVYIDDEALVDGYIDPVALKSVGKLGGDEFAKTTDIFSLKRPSL